MVKKQVKACVSVTHGILLGANSGEIEVLGDGRQLVQELVGAASSVDDSFALALLKCLHSGHQHLFT